MARAVAQHYGGKRVLSPNNDHWITAEPGWENPARDIADWLDALGPET